MKKKIKKKTHKKRNLSDLKKKNAPVYIQEKQSNRNRLLLLTFAVHENFIMRHKIIVT